MKTAIPRRPVDKWILDPIGRFMEKSTTSGLILFASATAALIIANSPWQEAYHHFWHQSFSIGFNDYVLSKTLHHWINDGLMAIFFFVVGLELKREIIGGELRKPKDAIMPIAAAIGGMVFPAAIYLLFNQSGSAADGWGIPMATDIAFALGVIYLLGNRVPTSLKVFLTVLAIADDIGAVLVIALFYTSNIDFASLSVGALFMVVLVLSNLLGVRNTLYYGIVGICGLWLAFLMSGVHATIAAVLAASTIPANVRISENFFNIRLSHLLDKFKAAKPNNMPTVSHEQFEILSQIRLTTKYALTPLQRLEHGMHPLVAFVILPIFAFSNAGITLSTNSMDDVLSPVALGVMLGLILGKVIGVASGVFVVQQLRIAQLPVGMGWKEVWSVGLLAAIGFTMSLFITELAFPETPYVAQAKIGILAASVFAGALGFFVLRFFGNSQQNRPS
jgi:NhaA family Na+:H+ antiporter